MNETASTLASPLNLIIPRKGNAEPLKCTLQAGDAIFVVGANGTGKSALMQQLAISLRQKSNITFKQFTAHRQNWSNSDAPTESPAQRQQVEQNIRNLSGMWTTRHQDTYASQKISIIISGIRRPASLMESATRPSNSGLDKSYFKI